MSLMHRILVSALLLLVLAGCRIEPIRTQPLLTASPPASSASSSGDEPNRTKLVSYQPSILSTEAIPAPVPQIDLAGELSLERLIAEVQAIHPSVEAMHAAWQAAALRFPQVISLDDPMFAATFAPASFGSPDVEGAYALELSQKLPWRGKRMLRGAVAEAEAAGANRDVESTKQKLMEVTSLAYWDFYLTRHQLELNQQFMGILQSLRENANTRYQTGLVTSQDVLQADIELANLEQRRIELDRMATIAAGRINVLLRRNPTFLLPPPTKSLPQLTELPNQEFLLVSAVQARPEIAAAAARLQAEEAKLGLAYKDFYPDLEFFGRYDTFWQPSDTQSDLRSQVGVRMNVPTYRARRNSAVEAAQQEVSKARAEYEQLVLEVQSDVQAAYEQVRESHRTLDVYLKRLLPAAEQNVTAARANYDASKINFLDLAVSQRQLIEARERLLQAQVELQRRIATLRRATGVR